MTYENIIVEKKNGMAKITLNRPRVLNAMNEALLQELVAALEDAEADESVRVVVVTGAGRAFSAGRDLKSISTGGERPGADRYAMLERLSKPTIAAVNGFCYTGAFELAMCADIIIASENAVFADTHARYGMVPGGGATQRLPRAIGSKRAKELFFTSDTVTAREAERLGIVNKVVPPEKLDEAVEEMVAKIVKNSPDSIRIMKSLVNNGMRMDLEAGLRLEQEHHKGRLARTEDSQDRFQSFMERK
ncbi:MAG: enoyl-CoA hydratase/isomerase family protein [Chloroflexota bacterium]|nr:enoyl-CoA hydratase/isomerase family protein [Chloroflexota bacterium]